MLLADQEKKMEEIASAHSVEVGVIKDMLSTAEKMKSRRAWSRMDVLTSMKTLEVNAGLYLKSSSLHVEI